MKKNKINHFKFRETFHFDFVTWITRLLCEFTFKNKEVENPFTPFEMKGYLIFSIFILKCGQYRMRLKQKQSEKTPYFSLFTVYGLMRY